MRPLFRNRFLIVVMTLFLGITVWLLLRSFSNEEKNEASEPVFTGSDACISCHESEYDAWKQSDHYKSMQVANRRTVLGDFNKTAFVSKGFTNRMFKKDSSFYMVLKNQKGVADTFRVEYTFGYYPLQQYIVEFPKGRYQCTQIAWDSREKKWFDLYPNLHIQPDEWMHWTGGSQTWNGMCADCHSTNLEKNYNESTNAYHTTWDEIDVACESCHGPGSEHVRIAQKNPDSEAAYSSVFLGKNSQQSEQIQFCARCHSRRSQLNNNFNHTENWMQQYSPDILRPGLYFADGQIKDEVYVWGSFTQSKMYMNGVRCTDCHDPHTYKRKLPGNQLCNQCHASQVYDTKSHHFHEQGTEGAKCESCHMPGRYYMVNDYRPDHSFRVPRPDLSVKYDVPNACNKCHDDKSARWAANQVVKWYGKKRKFHYSEVLTKAVNHESSPEEINQLMKNDSVPEIAKATAIYYLEYYPGNESMEVLLSSLNSRSSLVRRTAVEGLATYDINLTVTRLAQMLYDTAQIVRLAAFNTLTGTDFSSQPEIRAKYEQVKQEFFDAHKNNADFPSEMFNMGQYYQRTGQTALAQQYYEKTLETDNYQNMARMNLSIIYNTQNENQKAVDLLKKVVGQEPNYDPAYYSLGLVFAEMSQPDSAIFYLNKCIQINNQNTDAYYNLGLLYQQQKLSGKAENTFLTGLKFNPKNGKLLYVTSWFYLNENKIDTAKKYAQKLGQLYPNSQEYQQIAQLLENY